MATASLIRLGATPATPRRPSPAISTDRYLRIDWTGLDEFIKPRRGLQILYRPKNTISAADQVRGRGVV